MTSEQLSPNVPEGQSSAELPEWLQEAVAFTHDPRVADLARQDPEYARLLEADALARRKYASLAAQSRESSSDGIHLAATEAFVARMHALDARLDYEAEKGYRPEDE
jgi:hypothetical protein